MMISIKEFCDKHDACVQGRAWALDKCKDMNEVWEKAKPHWLIWIATRRGVLATKELMSLCFLCADQVKSYATEGALADLDIIKRLANGEKIEASLNIDTRYGGLLLVGATRAYSDRVIVAVISTYQHISSFPSVNTYCDQRLADYIDDVCYYTALAIDGSNTGSSNTDNLIADWLRTNTKPNFER